MTRLHSSFFGPPIAHRGLHDQSIGIVENSLSAIRAAIDAGYGIEIDLQPASDMTPMVFHDYMLNRLTGLGGTIIGYGPDKLETIKLTGTDEGIPTLATVLNEVDGRVPLLIEIKDQDMRLGENVGVFQKAICEALNCYQGPMALMSFNPHAIEAVKALNPDIPIGLVTDPFDAEDWPGVSVERRAELAEIGDAARLGVDFISHLQSDLESAPVARLKALGMPVFCWTVRSAEDEHRARKVADNITFEGYSPASRT